MTDPQKEYNLEFVSSRHNLAKDLEGILPSTNSAPTAHSAKGVNVVYIKASEQIEDLLTLYGGRKWRYADYGPQGNQGIAQ